MRFRHRIQYGLYLGVKTLLRCLPHAAMPALGHGLGDLAFRLDRSDRRIALSNLALVFPEEPERERHRLARQSFRELGAALCETLSAARFSPEALRRQMVFEGWENLEKAQEGGRGAFLLGAHLGCWELAAYAVALTRGTVHVVSNVLRNPLFDRELRRLRQPYGIEIIDKKGAARRMYRVLKGGGRIGIALDQRVRPEEAVDVTFLGRPSLTSPLPAHLSLWTGAAVLPIFVVPEGSRYRILVRPPIEPEGEGREAIIALSQRYVETIEAEIRRQPERWLWLYRRWRDWDMTSPRRSSLVEES